MENCVKLGIIWTLTSVILYINFYIGMLFSFCIKCLLNISIFSMLRNKNCYFYQGSLLIESNVFVLRSWYLNVFYSKLN